MKTPGEFIPLLLDSKRFTTSTLTESHTLFLIRRPSSKLSVTTWFQDRIVHVVSLHVQSMLLTAYRQLGFLEQMELYRRLSGLDFARTLVGRFFGEYCHAKFQNDGICIKHVEMVRRKASRRSRHRYYSSHRRLEDEGLEDLRQAVPCHTLMVKPTSTRTYTENPNNRTKELTPGRYYFPSVDNQTTTDSFILIEDTLYVFQFAIEESVDIKSGIVPFLESTVASQWNNVVFIFIIPRDLAVLTCAYPDDAYLRELRFYSARVRV
jgi:hypothetical protein